MKRVHWLVLTLVVASSLPVCHGQEAQPNGDGDQIQNETPPISGVKMFVVTTEETGLMRDKQVLLTLDKGTRVPVSAINGDRIRVEAQVEGRKEVGWVHIGDVMVTPDPRSRLCQTTDIGQFAEIPKIGGSTHWRESLNLTEVTKDGAVVLSLDSAVQLARIHSPLYQRQLDVLYRSSLNVATERGGRRFREAGKGTDAEAALRNNLAAFSQFKQGFYTQIAIGELGVDELTSVSDHPVHDLWGGCARGSESAVEVIGGFIGLLQQLQHIRNAENIAHLQLRALSQLEALLDVGVIDLAQVDRFRQSVENDRAKLTHNRIDFELSLDCYMTCTLGLPPDLPVELDDRLIRQFQLVGHNATAAQNSIAQLQERVGRLPVNASSEAIRQIMEDVFRLVELLDRYMDDVQADLARMDEAVPERERSMTDTERKRFRRDRELLGETLTDVEKQFRRAKVEFERLREGLSEQTGNATARRLVVSLSDFLRLVQRATLVQGRACLEGVTVETIEMSSQEAFAVALKNRPDIMTTRAELVRRSQEIAALRAELDSGPDTTPDDLLRRKSRYRQTLIDFQRDHRQYVETFDAVHQGLRQTLRSLEGLRVNLEIQRCAVVIAIRRVDLSHEPLNAPTSPPAPGQRMPQFGPAAATGLMASLSGLRDTQSSFMRCWLNHLAARMVLSRDLGIMVLDEKGRWVDTPLPTHRSRESKHTTPRRS